MVEAFVYDDQAEVACFSKVNDPNVTFESLGDPERERFKNLDMTLSNILQRKIGRSGELGRLVAKTSQNMYRAGNLITGRQIAQRLRANDELAMVYSITDLCKVTWLGGTPDQVSRVKGRREKVLDNMSTKLDEDTLRDLLL